MPIYTKKNYRLSQASSSMRLLYLVTIIYSAKIISCFFVFRFLVFYQIRFYLFHCRALFRRKTKVLAYFGVNPSRSAITYVQHSRDVAHVRFRCSIHKTKVKYVALKTGAKVLLLFYLCNRDRHFVAFQWRFFRCVRCARAIASCA